VADEKISPRDAEELAECLTAHARDLFGYACVVARGDRALADDLVQAAFEAAGRAWWSLRCLAEEQRRGWLRATLANIAVSGFRCDAAFRDRLPRIEARYRKTPADTPAQAFSAMALQRCWQIIDGMPERRHAVALLRWQQDMKESAVRRRVRLGGWPAPLPGVAGRSGRRRPGPAGSKPADHEHGDAGQRRWYRPDQRATASRRGGDCGRDRLENPRLPVARFPESRLAGMPTAR
jgi:DNA-directed RNA polymerase specialized sigma24 family protein